MECPEHPLASLVEDYRAGDLICPECGLVVGDRVFEPWFRPPPSPASPPSPPSPPTPASSRVRTHAQPRPLSSGNNNNRGAFAQEIESISERLHIPAFIRTKAVLICLGLEPKTEQLAAASLYYACRVDGCARSIGEICAASACSRREMISAMRRIRSHIHKRGGMGIVVGQPTCSSFSPEQYLDRFASRLGLERTHVVLPLAREWLSRMADTVSSSSPISMAALALWKASGIPIESIAKATGVSKRTILNLHRRLATLSAPTSSSSSSASSDSD